MPKIEKILVVEKFTKNKVRFKEEGIEGEELGTFPIIYIRQDALIKAGMLKPDRIKVTVEEA